MKVTCMRLKLNSIEIIRTVVDNGVEILPLEGEIGEEEN